jgi:CDP-diacylglycerol--glycerol-3-phosphate 3-phosphatidyltransferase
MDRLGLVSVPSTSDVGRMRYVPNVLTIIRLCLVPVFILAMVQAGGQTLTAGLIFLAAAFTDFLDGFLARKTGSLSMFGKIVDPLADRLLVGSAAILLSIYDERVPPWTWAVVIGRDVLVAIGFFLTRRKTVPDVTLLGKAGTALMMAGLAWLLLLPESQVWPAWLFWIGVALSVAAFVQYFIKYRWVLGSESAMADKSQPMPPVYSGDDDSLGEHDG